MAALATTIQVSSERGRAGVLDSEEYTKVKPGQPGSVLFNKTVAMRANDIGHLKGWRFHFFCSFLDRFTWAGPSSSRVSGGGLGALGVCSRQLRGMDSSFASACPCSCCNSSTVHHPPTQF